MVLLCFGRPWLGAHPRFPHSFDTCCFSPTLLYNFSFDQKGNSMTAVLLMIATVPCAAFYAARLCAPMPKGCVCSCAHIRTGAHPPAA